MHLQEGQEEAFQNKLQEIRQKQKYVLAGTVARSIAQSDQDPSLVQFLFLWRQQCLPSAEERAAALASLRADLEAVCDWEHASIFEGTVLLNT